MDITINPRKLCGTVAAIPSKSQAHRLLICAAFADRDTHLYCPQVNRDIEATADCLRALGAQIHRTDTGFVIHPICQVSRKAVLPCGESGSTLRFMLPIVGALGVDGTFLMEGRLPQRPLSPLWEEMERMGCFLSRPKENELRCTGQLIAGKYTIAGNVSSQYITGLLFGLSIMSEPSSLEITGTVESKPYIQMTCQALEAFGITVELDHLGGAPFRSRGEMTVEGDWSNAAFFLAAEALGNPVTTTGLNPLSCQGDRAVSSLLPILSDQCVIDAADIPDLVPILSIVAAANRGAEFKNIQRLRLKESDRVASVIAMLHSFGASACATEDTLSVYPAPLTGGTIDSAGDHRIAMAAAIGATVASGSVTISGAQCVSKSYPSFWEEYKRLGGSYEQYIR